MKKVGLILLPLMAFSFLTNCGGSAKTEDSTVKILIPNDAVDLNFVIECASDNNFSVNWGDGTTNNGNKIGEYVHKYKKPGEYTIRVSNVTGIYLYDSTYNNNGYVKEIYIGESIILAGCNDCFSITSIKVSPKNPYYDSRNNCNAIIAKRDLKLQGETYVTANTLIYGCKNTIIPDSVVSIGPNAFSFCDVSSMVIPDSVISIGNEAFYGCPLLTSLTIPDSIVSVGASAFGNCPALSLYLENNVNYLGNNANKCVVAVSVVGSNDTYTISNQCRVLYSYMFAGSQSLVSIAIPGSVVSIGEGVFEDCASLTFVDISNGVTSIGDSAFSFCPSLESVVIPNSVISIGDSIFCDCFSLTFIGVSDNVESIGMEAFAYTAITSIEIPSKVKKLSDYMFQGCEKLSSITFPDTITEIGECAFEECVELTSFNIPNTVTTIGKSAFEQSGLTSITIPDSVTSLENRAFAACMNLETITIGSGITTIPSGAFQETAITSITIPAQITSIGDDAFYSCKNLETVDLTAFTKKANIPSADSEAFYTDRKAKFKVSSTKMREAFKAKGGGWPTDDSKYLIDG